MTLNGRFCDETVVRAERGYISYCLSFAFLGRMRKEPWEVLLFVKKDISLKHRGQRKTQRKLNLVHTAPFDLSLTFFCLYGMTPVRS